MKDTSNTATFTVHMFIYTCTCTLVDIILHQYFAMGIMLYSLKLPYGRKYWQSLNLAVWSQAAEIKILAVLNLAVIPVNRRIICTHT